MLNGIDAALKYGSCIRLIILKAHKSHPGKYHHGSGLYFTARRLKAYAIDS